MTTNLGPARLAPEHPASRSGRPVLLLSNTGDALTPLEARHVRILYATAEERIALRSAGFHLRPSYTHRGPRPAA